MSNKTPLKTAYMVNTIKQDVTVMVMGQEKQLPLKDLADGCIGVSLWFDTQEHAIAWAEDGDFISKGNFQPKTTTQNNKEAN